MDLGVDALWLGPVFKSPMKDFGYDISDYKDIDPVFGTMEDFEELVDTAHSKGKSFLLDLTCWRFLCLFSIYGGHKSFLWGHW